MVAFQVSSMILSLAVFLSSELATGFHIPSRISRPTLLFDQSSNGESENHPTNFRTKDVEGLGKVLNFISAGLAFVALPLIQAVKAEEAIPKISLKPLPYDYNALSPYISAKTLSVHHDKHHAKYVSTTLSMIKGTDLESADLVTLMKNTQGVAPVIFNNAAQSWNHDFYWKCMKNGGGGAPSGKAAAAISKNFGNYETFKTQV